MLQARLDIQSDIDSHTRTIIDLKSTLNTLTPIGSLPPELLSEILVHCAVDDYQRASCSSERRGAGEEEAEERERAGGWKGGAAQRECRAAEEYVFFICGFELWADLVFVCL